MEATTEVMEAYTGMDEDDIIADIRDALHFSCFDSMEEAAKYRIRRKGQIINGYKVSIRIDKIT